MKTEKKMPIDSEEKGYFDVSDSLNDGTQLDSQGGLEINQNTQTNHDYLNGGDDYFSSHIGNPII